MSNTAQETEAKRPRIQPLGDGEHITHPELRWKRGDIRPIARGGQDLALLALQEMLLEKTGYAWSFGKFLEEDLHRAISDVGWEPFKAADVKGVGITANDIKQKGFAIDENGFVKQGRFFITMMWFDAREEFMNAMNQAAEDRIAKELPKQEYNEVAEGPRGHTGRTFEIEDSALSESFGDRESAAKQQSKGL